MTILVTLPFVRLLYTADTVIMPPYSSLLLIPRQLYKEVTVISLFLGWRNKAWFKHLVQGHMRKKGGDLVLLWERTQEASIYSQSIKE